MGCSECDSDTGDLVRVEYTDDTAEEVVLCADCREEFTDAELINEVEAAETE